jgi:hypothetical protein
MQKSQNLKIEKSKIFEKRMQKSKYPRKNAKIENRRFSKNIKFWKNRRMQKLKNAKIENFRKMPKSKNRQMYAKIEKKKTETFTKHQQSDGHRHAAEGYSTWLK